MTCSTPRQVEGLEDLCAHNGLPWPPPVSSLMSNPTPCPSQLPPSARGTRAIRGLWGQTPPHTYSPRADSTRLPWAGWRIGFREPACCTPSCTCPHVPTHLHWLPSATGSPGCRFRVCFPGNRAVGVGEGPQTFLAQSPGKAYLPASAAVSMSQPLKPAVTRSPTAPVALLSQEEPFAHMHRNCLS